MDRREDEKKIEEQIELIGAHLEMRKIKAEELIEHHEITGKEMDHLVENGKIVIADDGHIRFTEEGEKKFTTLIRNHRLAERLMTDVLVISDTEAESVACEFEHFLNTGVADSICTFLGHPRTCPHGRPIPPGRCCSEKKKQVGPIIVPLSELNPGESGKVAYIATRNHSRLDKLTSMGIMPGKLIRTHQKNPAIVVMFDETTLSMDSEIAGEIFVRYEKS